VAIYEGDEMNAFATGWNRNSALVAVSSGLLGEMRDDEIEAVLAHEVSHIANGDMVTMALIQGVVNTFVMVLSRVVGHLVDRVVFKTERGHGPAFWITTVVAEMVLGVLASTIVFWFSRQREYRADEGAAALAGKKKMIAALTRLGAGQSQPLPDQLAAFGIAGGEGWSHLFRTHPSLQQRIEHLKHLK
ncbi:MAG: protease HtpX, partial [Gammaproteobacteria bacterium]|nr:protease HtpX [Gammaproteobacteria bacterium]